MLDDSETRRLRRALYLLTGSRFEADAIVADVVVALAERSPDPEVPADLAAYQLAMERVRQLGVPDTAPGRAGAGERLRQSLLALPLAQREVVVLYDDDPPKALERIAAILGLSGDEVATRILEAQARLRELMKGGQP